MTYLNMYCNIYNSKGICKIIKNLTRHKSLKIGDKLVCVMIKSDKNKLLFKDNIIIGKVIMLKKNQINYNKNIKIQYFLNLIQIIKKK